MRSKPASLGLFALLSVLPFGTQAGAQVTDSAELERLGSCAVVEGYLRDLALAHARRMAEQWRRYRDRLGYRTRASEEGRMGSASVPSSAPAGASADSVASGPGSHTRTNTQVAGVDEADFVKTDGKHLYVLTQGALFVLKS